MCKIILASFILAVVFGANCFETPAQNRKSVSAAEVNGTFRYDFTGKFKGSSNEIKILALGKGKLKISFDLVYPYLMGNGDVMVNIGHAAGIAEIDGDRAVFKADNEYSDEQCKISIKFLKPGEIKVEHLTSASACGFGHNVFAGGTYKKISSKKPVFDEAN